MDIGVVIQFVVFVYLGHKNGLGTFRPERRREQIPSRRNRILVDGKKTRYGFIFQLFSVNFRRRVLDEFNNI